MRRIVVSICAAALLAAGLVTAIPQAQAVAGFDLERIAGANRYETAALTALETFPNGADVALLARGDIFPDALSGTYLGGGLDAPVLLTERADLSAATADALDELGVADVVILGDSNSINDDVADGLDADGYNVIRIGGINRFATAALIATQFDPADVGVDLQGRRTAIVTNGQKFPDALVAGPLSTALGYPILLTNQASMPQVSLDALADLEIERVLVLGSSASVSQHVRDQLNGIGIPSIRLSGSDRAATAVKVAEYAIEKEGFDPTHVNVSTGDNFPDALAASVHGGREFAPLLFASTNNVPSSTCDLMVELAPQLLSGHLFGGTPSISSVTESDLEECADAPPVPAAAPTIEVTPASGLTVNGDGIIGTATPGDDRTYSARVELAKNYGIALFDVNTMTFNQDGTVQFDDVDGNNVADLTGASPVTTRIIQVNGADITPAQLVGSVTPTPIAGGGDLNGTITWKVDAADDEIIIPVIYEDPGDGPTAQLDLDEANLPIDVFGIGGRFIVGATGNQSISVSPSSAATIVANGTGSEANTPADDRTFTATGLDGTKTYRVTLLPADNVRNAGGSISFLDADNNNFPDLTPTPTAKLVTVNGAGVTPAQSVGSIAPSAGSINFVVDGDDPESIIPVVYEDPGPGGDTKLDLDANDKPFDPFGLGGTTVFASQPAPPGYLANDETVTILDKSQRTFFTLAPGDTYKGYVYDSNDQYFLDSTPTLADEVDTGTPITMSQFISALSRGDQLSAGSTYDPDNAGPSSFILEDLGPAAPVAALVSATDESALLTVTGLAAGYEYLAVYVGPNDDGAFNPATDLLRTTQFFDEDPDLAGVQVTVGGLDPNTSYDLFVTQFEDGDESVPSNRVDVTTTALVPRIVSVIPQDPDSEGSSEVVMVTFNVPVTSCTNTGLTITSGANTYDGDDPLLAFTDCVILTDARSVLYDLDGDTLTLVPIDDLLVDEIVRTLNPLNAIFDPTVGDGDRLYDSGNRLYDVVVAAGTVTFGAPVNAANAQLTGSFYY